jgi:hypothetical protein
VIPTMSRLSLSMLSCSEPEPKAATRHNYLLDGYLTFLRRGIGTTTYISKKNHTQGATTSIKT